MLAAARLYASAPAFLEPLPTTRTAVRLCAAGEQQWDEERECEQHLHALARKSAAVNKLREVLRPEGRAALGGDPAGAVSVSEADFDLWDEEIEAMAHLREMAAWENEVGKVKAVIEAAEARVAGTATAAQLSSGSSGNSDGSSGSSDSSKDGGSGQRRKRQVRRARSQLLQHRPRSWIADQSRTPPCPAPQRRQSAWRWSAARRAEAASGGGAACTRGSNRAAASLRPSFR